MRPILCSIVIHTKSNPGGEVMKAEVAWPLAVHASSSDPVHGPWTITHVPSGMRVVHGRDRGAALELMQQCFDVAPPSRWELVHQDPDPEIQSFVARMRGKATAGAHQNGGAP